MVQRTSLSRCLLSLLLLFLFSASPALSFTTQPRIADTPRGTLVVLEDGKVWGWGNNYNGWTLGWFPGYAASPIDITPTIRWKDVCGANPGTSGIREDGTLWGLGRNSNGDVGDGTTAERRYYWVQESTSSTNWSELACGDWHRLAVKADGTLWAWGSNAQGELGLGDTIPRNSPTQVGTDTDWAKVYASQNISYAIKTDGTIWCWGSNGYGRLGLGGGGSRYTPTLFSAAGVWTKIAIGPTHSLGIKTDGTLWSWGGNSSMNYVASGPSPTLQSAGNWIDAHPGVSYTLAIRADGTLWGTGNNIHGYLGDGTLANKFNIFQQIGTDANWNELGGGSTYTIAAKTDGTLWGWGLNNGGECGVGNWNTDIVIPTRVVGTVAFKPVTPPNTIPVALLQPIESLHPGKPVVLDGGSSYDTDNNYPLNFTWAVTAKPSGSTLDATSCVESLCTLSLDLPGSYTFSLTVTDALGAQSVSTDVSGNTSNSVPIADAGDDQSISTLGTTVSLDATQSYDPDGDTVSYHWELVRRPATSTATLSEITSTTPSFVADKNGDYEAALVVSDPWSSSVVDTILITFENVAPVAVPSSANQHVVQGDTVCLDASMSTDANGDTLTYLWELTSTPTGSSAVIASHAGTVTCFTADLPGQYIATLAANDGWVNSASVPLTIVAVSYETELTLTLADITHSVTSVLSPSDFRNKNMGATIANRVAAVTNDISADNYANALAQLVSLLEKTDGCETQIPATPDKTDWILDCNDQALVAPLLHEAIDLVNDLIAL